jgi:hypothetical protein
MGGLLWQLLVLLQLPYGLLRGLVLVRAVVVRLRRQAAVLVLIKDNVRSRRILDRVC